MVLRVLLVLVAGCAQSSNQAPSPIDLDGARAAVTTFFSAAAQGDCKTVIRMRLTPLTAHQCEDFVRHFGEHGTSLTEIMDVKRDGRAANRAMVRANVSFAGGPHEWIIRVEQRGEQYKVDVQ